MADGGEEARLRLARRLGPVARLGRGAQLPDLVAQPLELALVGAPAAADAANRKEMRNRESEKRAGEARQGDRRHIGQPGGGSKTRHATLHSAAPAAGSETRREGLRKGCGLAIRAVTCPRFSGVRQPEFVEAPERDRC